MAASERSRYGDTNRTAWDLRTAVHMESPYYGLEAFKHGDLTLKPPELELIADPAGTRLLHLQCHFGLDTLSWARLGAEATGVDISPLSVNTATQLAEELELGARFICADVQGMGEVGDPFDLVFCSYGVVCWLASLDAWAAEIRRNLRPGGRFVLVEFHPILEVLHPGKVSGTGRYFADGEPSSVHSMGTYTDPRAPISYWEYRWQHTVSDVIAALIGAGMAVEELREYPYCSYRLCDELDNFEDGVWKPSDIEGLLPYMFSVVATRP